MTISSFWPTFRFAFYYWMHHIISSSSISYTTAPVSTAKVFEISFPLYSGRIGSSVLAIRFISDSDASARTCIFAPLLKYVLTSTRVFCAYDPHRATITLSLYMYICGFEGYSSDWLMLWWVVCRVKNGCAGERRVIFGGGLRYVTRLAVGLCAVCDCDYDSCHISCNVYVHFAGRRPEMCNW